MSNKGRVLVTGTAGFIGYHVARRLCWEGREVVGFDSVNDYYDPTLKEARLRDLARLPTFRMIRGKLEDKGALDEAFAGGPYTGVIHLAAQAGVRYSLTNPDAYVSANIQGFLNILEACRHHRIGHLVYASSSSVYGGNTRLPFSLGDCVDHPISLYAASKKSNELMAHVYSHLFSVPTSGLRFFTVYGPWGRPDMAMFIFTKAILAGEPIKVFNHGDMSRDFTYIDDIVEGILRVFERPPLTSPGPMPQDDPSRSNAPFRVYNIGNSSPVHLRDMIGMLESAIGRKAKLDMQPMQPGDVSRTFANVAALEQEFDFKPTTPLETGIKRFVEWYRGYFGL